MVAKNVPRCGTALHKREDVCWCFAEVRFWCPEDGRVFRPSKCARFRTCVSSRKGSLGNENRGRPPQSVSRLVLQLPFLDDRQRVEAILRSLEGSFSTSLAPLRDGFLLQTLPRAQVIQTRRDAIPAEDYLLARLYGRELALLPLAQNPLGLAHEGPAPRIIRGLKY